MSEPMNPTAEEMFQEFLREFAKSAIEAYQYFDAEYGNNGDDQSRDAAIAAVMDEGHLGPDMFAGTGFYIIREQRDALKKQVQVLTDGTTRLRDANKALANLYEAVNTYCRTLSAENAQLRVDIAALREYKERHSLAQELNNLARYVDTLPDSEAVQ